jgi:hypothetical protein
MITSWDRKPHVIFVALLCAYALMMPKPAVAVSLLTADAFGAVSAGPDIGTPSKLITPVDGSVSVIFGATASASPAGVGLSASLLGSGEARFGALAGRARAEASSSPPGPHGVGGEVIVSLGFLDTAEVLSSALAPGTPVTLTFLMTLDATASHFANGPFTPTRFGAAARADARISDIEAGTSTPSFPNSPHTLVNSIGERITLTTFDFDTAIGHHLQIDVDLMAAARAVVDPAVFLGQASSGSAEVIADNTAHFFYQPSGDVRLVSESGHDYAASGPVPEPIPEPASLILLCVGSASILVATRRLSRLRRSLAER